MMAARAARLAEWARTIPNGVATGFVLFAATLILTTTAVRSESSAAAARVQATALADPILALCAQGGDVAARLASARTPDGRGLCDQAAATKADPVLASAPVDQVSDAHVVSLIRQELARQPAPAPVAPSQDQLEQAAAAVILAHPDLFRGQPGTPGTPPSDAQITAVVAAYLAAHPNQFRGLPGVNGRDGAAGRDGSNGSNGSDGTPGQPGSPGATVTETAPAPPPVTVTETAPPDAGDTNQGAGPPADSGGTTGAVQSTDAPGATTAAPESRRGPSARHGRSSGQPSRPSGFSPALRLPPL